jgi:hypothetical protein
MVMSERHKAPGANKNNLSLYKHTAGQVPETIAFTKLLYEKGRITADEKLRLDNEAMKANSLANLNGFETVPEETPGEWNKYEKRT